MTSIDRSTEDEPSTCLPRVGKEFSKIGFASSFRAQKLLGACMNAGFNHYLDPSKGYFIAYSIGMVDLSGRFYYDLINSSVLITKYFSNGIG